MISLILFLFKLSYSKIFISIFVAQQKIKPLKNLYIIILSITVLIYINFIFTSNVNIQELFVYYVDLKILKILLHAL